MTQKLKKQLQEKIDTLLKIHQGLKKLQRLPLKDLKNEIENVWAVSFGIVAGIEAMLDIGQYILAERDIRAEGYGDIPGKMQEAKIISKNFAEKFKIMIGFRNRAIHNYPSLDIKQLYGILQSDVNDFKDFIKVIKKYL
ncbi:DUF86 domain-containing protein [Patescibacteria group bacterium]|nr:DUF86 domain-containing protein [Candidatus Falkowbacteria bacterium]MBU3906249.1 DUF86 domain-containing protein [Patescibacteria group bacterium]MCG2697881.1 DUF86 domain-containing protein [Candidatus Parcubacteria bacterium]MBU4015701.1 DUF86 domain-containing protein [Patescibacteria group bacterium]MBU4026878.1 DUF86 domain-containing protein [Patescibacteria group bacterium]